MGGGPWITHLETWESGLIQCLAKASYRSAVPRVRISPSPPSCCKPLKLKGFFNALFSLLCIIFCGFCKKIQLFQQVIQITRLRLFRYLFRYLSGVPFLILNLIAALIFPLNSFPLHHVAQKPNKQKFLFNHRGQCCSP